MELASIVGPTSHSRETQTIRLASAAAVLLCALLVSNHITAETGPCDPGLDPPGDNPYGYRLRGDRCEGIYIEEVSGSVLHISSLTASTPSFDPASGKKISLTWKTGENRTVYLRAQSLTQRLYYRMDTQTRTPGNRYLWSPELLDALSIAPKEIGLIAWIKEYIADTERNVYLPVSILQDNIGPIKSPYQLMLLPGHELEEVYLSLAAVDSTGNPTTFEIDGEALGYGYYPANRPIRINIRRPETTGIHQIEIGALLRGGGAVATTLLFYHSD